MHKGIAIVMIGFLAMTLWGHGGLEGADTTLYNLYVDGYNFCIDIINEVL